MKDSKPVVCTLSANDLIARCRQWRDVLTRSRAAVKPLPNGVAIRFSADAQTIAEIKELARVERSCCQWMTLDIRHENDGETTLLMTADSKEGIETIAAIVA